MEKQIFDKRLAGYSAMAAAMLMGGQSDANIVTHSAGNYVLNSNGDNLVIDFEQTGSDGNDIRIECFSNPSNIAFAAFNFDYNYGGGFLGSFPTPYYVYPFALNASASLPFANPQWASYFPGSATLDENSGYYGNWFNKTNKYLGVKFLIDGQKHIGFVKMSIIGRVATIHLYGYETTPNTGIDSPLPVELSSFTAMVKDRAVVLEWTTESEKDNLGFILERQLKDASTWERIASYHTDSGLKGQGTKTTRTNYEYRDELFVPGESYCYRLSYEDVNGGISSENIVEIATDNTAVPDQTALLPAYPNPFNPGTTIQYRLADDAPVTLDVIDITGRTVRSIVKENQSAGSYSFAWDGKDNSGNSSPSGIYMLVLKAGSIVKTQKVTRLR